MPTLNRRDFLKLAASGLLSASGILALGGLLRYLSHPANPAPPTEFDLGLAENYPPGSLTPVADGTALLIHSEDGFHALSLTCTHLGCIVEATGDGFLCPCHGSTFDAKGTSTRGPAAKPLRALFIQTNDAGHLILSTAT
jgi:cytochrome b6-f complex iron-sulfur subunit